MSIYLNIAELATRADVDSLNTLFTSKLQQHLQHLAIQNNSESVGSENDDSQNTVYIPISRHFVFELLLYFLPEALDVSQYAPLLFQAYNLPDDSPQIEFSPLEAGLEKHVAQKLLNYGWKYSFHFNAGSISQTSVDDLLASFVKCRMRIIDDTRRELVRIESLLVAFPEYPKRLVEWQNGCVDVLQNFRQYYMKHNQPWIALHEFESAAPNKMAKFLLQYSNKDSIFRDLNHLLVPYSLYYKSPNEIWNWVGKSFSTSRHLELVLSVISKGGMSNPDIQPAFLRHVFSLMYLYTGVSTASFTFLTAIIQNLEGWNLGGNKSLDLSNIDVSQGFDFESIANSKLAEPCVASLNTIKLFVDSAAILQVPVKEVVTIRLFGSKEDQEALAHTFIFGKSGSTTWKSFGNEKWERILGKMQWMQNVSKVFGKLDSKWVYSTFLTAVLSTASFNFVRQHYIDDLSQNNSSLSSEKVKTEILNAFYTFFDSATNGNKTRGQMKNANNCLKLLCDSDVAPNNISRDTEDAFALLSAVHELSNYSLYLSEYELEGNSNAFKNMPMTPKQIRLYPDPAKLIHRVLELNPKAYTNMDDLVTITLNLIQGRQRLFNGGNPSTKISDASIEAISNRVRKMCVEAALVDSNFDKAYELSLPFMDNSNASEASTQYKFIEDIKKSQAELCYGEAADTNSSEFEEDIETWASLFQVGKFVSPNWDPDHIPLEILQKKMSTLSHALKICPSDQLSQVLGFWKRVELQMQNAQNRSSSSSSTSSFASSLLANRTNAFNDNRLANLGTDLGGGFRDGISSLAAGKTFYNIGSSVGKNMSQKLTAAVSSAPSLLPAKFSRVLNTQSPPPQVSATHSVDDYHEHDSFSSSQSRNALSSNFGRSSYANNSQSQNYSRQPLQTHRASRSNTTSPMQIVDEPSSNFHGQDSAHSGFGEHGASSSLFSGNSEQGTDSKEHNATDQISSLLVSGLGWAIGANPR